MEHPNPRQAGDNPPLPAKAGASPELLPNGSACAYPAWTPPLAIRLHVLPEHPCSYLPGRIAQTRALWADQISPAIYHQFMDAGFRRSGKLVYQPICRGCRACLPVRVPAASFLPSKSQRRVWKRNADLSINITEPELTDEKWELYERYVRQWHQQSDPGDRQSLADFLYASPVETVELSYRTPTGKLVGVGLCDVSAASLSSVYFYFDPLEADRGLGTFSALKELRFCSQWQIPYYYLGYWIDTCTSMAYKASFRPCEILHPDGVWR